MNRPWHDLAVWVRRAQPPRRSLRRALGASFFASVTSLALFVGAPYLLVVSASDSRLVAGGSLAALLIVIELLAFARSPMRYVERLSAHDLGLRAVSAWRRWLILAVGAWPFQRWRTAATGDLLERALGDTDVLQDLWLRAIVPLVATSATMVLADVLVLTLPSGSLHAGATAAGLLACQVVGVTVLLAQLPRQVADERAVRAARAARTAERVSLQQVAPEIELLGRTRFLTDRLDAATRDVAARERRRDRRLRGLHFVVAVGPLVALGVVGGLANAPADLQGRHGLVALLLAVAVGDLLAVARQSVSVAATVTAATERLDALAYAAPHGATAWPAHTLLDVEHLRVAYDGDEILRDVSLTVAPGRRVAITGPSGSGKSTLLRLLARLDDPPARVVTVGGVDLLDLDETSLRRHLAYVGAHPALLTGIVDHVIRVGRVTTDDVADSLAELGLRASGTTRWEHLSRGEAQRAALVRGLLDEPTLVLLDEPTSGLGPAERALVLARLERVAGTIVIATHDDDVIAWCDEQYAVADGRLEPVSR